MQWIAVGFRGSVKTSLTGHLSFPPESEQVVRREGGAGLNLHVKPMDKIHWLMIFIQALNH